MASASKDDGDGSAPKAFIGGVACRLPKSNNIQEFWENLINGVDMIDFTRWPPGLHGVPPRLGLIPDIEKFDSLFFGFQDHEVNGFSPMYRHLLEVTCECIIDSGLDMKTIHNSRVGYYLSCFLTDTDCLETSRPPLTCSLMSIGPNLAGSVTQWFSLNGPIVMVDTACSSSISALHMAVTDLVIGRCEYAIVASANLIFNPNMLQQMGQLNMLCPEGRSRVMDAEAGGYVRAEGVVAMLLSRKPDDCKRIYASVIDVGVNCDGYKNEGITYPSKQMQVELVRQVFDRSGIHSNQLAYVEAHSTGTQAGDFVEVSGLMESLGEGRDKRLLIGSVKSNMGHSEATAGLAGIAKCLLIAKHKLIPPNINFKTPNPKIESILSGKLKLVTEPTPLEDGYIAVNSFGFGGANGHVILQPFRAPESTRETEAPKHGLVLLGARSEAEVTEVQGFVKAHRDNPSVLGLLSDSSLSADMEFAEPVRAFVQFGPDEEDFVVECRGFYTPLPLHLIIEDFAWYDLCVAAELLENKSIKNSLLESKEILSKLDPPVDPIYLIQSQQPLPPLTLENITVATAVLIGMVDCMEQTGLEYEGVTGCGLSEIISSYVDNSLTKDQALKVAHSIGQILEKHSKDKEWNFSLYQIQGLQMTDVYLLGPKVRVLSLQTEKQVIVAVHGADKDRVLKLIHDKGGYYQELSVQTPLYSAHLQALHKEITDRLQTVITAPKQRSPRVQSGTSVTRVLQRTICDATFFADILKTCVNEVSVLNSLKTNLTVLKVCLEPSCGTVNVKLREDSVSSKQILHCQGSLKTLYSTLGELHLQGHQVKVNYLYDVSYPLGCEAPFLSPLIRWDHSANWNIPEWPEFSCRVKDDEICPYVLYDSELEGIHTPAAYLLYHAWLAIIQRLQKVPPKEDPLTPPLRLFDLAFSADSELKLESLPGSKIVVHPGRQRFIVENDDCVLMTGAYEICEKSVLPKVPGYDLDINENIPDNETILHKTEIMWEDSWLDFLNAMLEFATQHTQAPLYQLIIDPEQHMNETKNCANMLTVVEKYTGLCKSGSIAFHFLVTQTSQQPIDNTQKYTVPQEYMDTSVSKVVAYSVQGVNTTERDRVFIYTGANQNTAVEQVLGVLMMTDGEILCREVPLTIPMTDEDLDVLVPYLLSIFVLCDVVGVSEGKTVLILPPLDTMGIYLIAIANQLGCSVFTSSWDLETQQLLDSIFPFVRVLPAQRLTQNIMKLTQGQGCDICIRCAGGDLGKVMDLVASDGLFVQCTPPPEDALMELSIFQKNRTIKFVKPLQAFHNYVKKSSDDIQSLLCNTQSEAITKLSAEGFPETKGLLYCMDTRVGFLQPIRLQRLMSLLEEPGLSGWESTDEDLTEADILAVERLQTLTASKPKDYSLAELRATFNTSCSMLVEDGSVSKLEKGMIETPVTNKLSVPQTLLSDGTSPSDELCVITLTGITPDSPVAKENPGPPTSTPMITVTSTNDEPDTGHKDLYESFIEVDPLPPLPSKSAFKKIPARLEIPSHIRVDLLLRPTPARTPLTPMVKQLLTPTQVKPSLVPLNALVGECPLYIVHPITGMVTLLQSVGKSLDTPCYGIQKTEMTPQDSIESMASYYKNAIQMNQPNGPYRIAGYSFGSAVAVEMAHQFQSLGAQVECLILLDGTPGYLHSHLDLGLKVLPPGASQYQVEEVLETGALLEFITFFAPVPSRTMLHKVLMKLPSLDSRVDVAVDYTMGNAMLSPSPQKTKWMTAKEKLLKKSKPTRSEAGFFHAAQEIVRLKRIEKAKETCLNIKAAHLYRPKEPKFQGDIHLLRVKNDPVFSLPVAADYGAKSLCTGTVHVRYHEGDHQTFLKEDALVSDLKEILSGLGGNEENSIQPPNK